MSSVKKITFLHFNDVYNVEASSQEPVGGAARFTHLVKTFSDSNPLILFSGDCFSPSLMSTITRGTQMITVLNTIGVQVACLGNHDLDFGLDHFTSLAKQCTFPWLVGNAFDKETNQPLGGLKKTCLIEWGGVKVGILGLIEEDWIATLATLEPSDVVYHDFKSAGVEMATDLRSQGAEIIIALTHMRQPNDILLLQSVPEIDVVMGGHDHSYDVQFIQPHGNLLIKSGNEFQDLTRLDVDIDSEGKKQYSWEHLRVTGSIPEDEEMKTLVAGFHDSLSAVLDQSIGNLSVDLDGRFEKIRTEETNLGSFVCDVLRSASRAEVCFLNSGTFRSNKIHPSGAFTKRDLLDILPFIDETVVLKISGEVLLKALENGVSQYPKYEGRFLQVSGISFQFDEAEKPGSRILADSVYLHDRNENFRLEEMYTVCTKTYIAGGKDGFEVLKDAEVLVHSEQAPVLPTCVRYHFMVLDVLTTWKTEVICKPNYLVRKFADQLKDRVVKNAKLKNSTLVKRFCDELKCYTVHARAEGRVKLVSKTS